MSMTAVSIPQDIPDSQNKLVPLNTIVLQIKNSIITDLDGMFNLCMVREIQFYAKSLFGNGSSQITNTV